MTPANQHDIPGKVLAAHREAMGWTVEQVADQLKLAVRQVVALEAGDYASLPSAAVTRGFVRAYAKLVKVDPAPLVARIAIENEGASEANPGAMRRPAPASFSQTKFPSHGKKRSALPLGLIAAAVVIVAAAGAAWHFGVIPIGQHGQRGEAATTAAPAPAAASPEAANGNATETLQNPAVPLISVPGPNGAAPAAPPAAGPAAQPATGPAAPANPAAAQAKASAPSVATAAPSAAPAAAAPAAPAAPAAAAPAAGANALVINVRENSWIDVRPAKGGAPLISRLVTAGSTETIAVDQPVRVVVGNPGGVTATLRGAAVALPAVPGKTLARVNLQ
jgi:cytoskeleton protein RodZ